MGTTIAALGIFNFIFMAVGIFVYLNAKRFAATAREASGVVIDEEGAGTGFLRIRMEKGPTIRFKTAEGREIVFTSRSKHDLPIGEMLSVSYDPADPQRARIGSPSNQRRLGTVFLAFCLLSSFLMWIVGFNIVFRLWK